MALPPKGDPQRPLALAVRSTRFLGILFIGLGMCGTVPLFLRGLGVATRPAATTPLAAMGFVALGTILLYFGPGALYLVCSVFIARRRTWAVVTAMVLAGFHILLLAIAMAAVGVVYFSAVARARSSAGYLLIPIGVVVAFIVALAQLEFHLSKCFEAIRRAPVDMQRGFEPLPLAHLAPAAQPVPPPPPADIPLPGDSHGPPA